MSPIIERITGPLELGEGPHWDVKSQSLYFVDIFKSTIHKYKPDTKTYTSAKVGGRSASFIVPVEGDGEKFLIGYGGDVAAVTWDGISDKISSLNILATLDSSPRNRLNDGKVSPSGILYAGSMSLPTSTGDFEKEVGIFSSFKKNNEVKQHLDKITISNGLAWSRDEKVFYYIDSGTGKIEYFDYDAKNDVISNRRTLLDLKTSGLEGIADGMTIDTEGQLWFANFKGHQVVRIDAESGKILTSIRLPAPQITSVAFGGRNLDELYVTSAYVDLKDDEKAKYPQSGCTFKITGLDVKGFPGVAFPAI